MQDLVDGFTCVCEESYAGRYCEKNVAGCSSSPCLNDGLCFDLAEGYKCVCLGGYSGKRCEIDSDPCDPDPCLNGGSCYPMSGGDIYCQCPDDYQGKFCTSKKTHCQLHLCNGEILSYNNFEHLLKMNKDLLIDLVLL